MYFLPSIIPHVDIDIGQTPVPDDLMLTAFPADDFQ